MSDVVITKFVAEQMIAHCLEAYPLEGCGLLGARPNGNELITCYPTRNAAESSRVYTIDPKDMMRADRDADDNGLEIAGVFHSHTHTHAYPSPTDVKQAPVPTWHYVLVTFEHDEPEIRSFRVVDAEVTEETVLIH